MGAPILARLQAAGFDAVGYDPAVSGGSLASVVAGSDVEELDVLASLAADAAVPFELSSLVARLHREALARFGAVPGELLAARLLEERAGTNLRPSTGILNA